MAAAVQLVIMDQGTADHRTEDQDHAVRNILQTSLRRLCDGGALGVVLEGNGYWAALLKGITDVEAVVVAKGSAHLNESLIHVDDAGKGDGNAGDTVGACHGRLPCPGFFTGFIVDPADRFYQILAAGLGRRDAAMGKKLHLFVHDGIFDGGSAYIDHQ